MNHVASRSFVLASLLVAAVSGCGKDQLGTAGIGETCLRNADCTAPFICLNAKCSLAEAVRCSSGERRCDGDVLQECDTTRGDFADVERCETGCSAGACREPVCTAGASRCHGGVVERCAPSGTSWAFFRHCPYGCEGADSDACKPPACPPFDVRCSASTPTVQEECDPFTGYVATDCAAGGAARTCAAGRCVARACTAGESRCDGDVVETCNAAGTDFVPDEICEFGCGGASGNGACLAAACNTGAESCDGDALVRCAPDRRSFGLVQFCPAGCAANGSSADCIACSCSPLSRRCVVDGTTGSPVVEQCRADCTGYAAVEQCSQACSGGVCVLSDANCAPGDRRCNGREAEVCARTAAGGTEWRFAERCLGACNGTACGTGGACGCTGNLTTGSACGTSTRPPFRLFVMVPSLADGSPVVTPAADSGRSSFLFHTDPIVGNDGQPVPDGTLVTFVHDGADALFASQDADNLQAGLQRPTVSGRARVVMKSPAAAREVTVTASLGGRCGATRSLRFIGVAPGTRTIYVAEDFSTSRLFDRAQAVTQLAQWETGPGRVSARGAFELGTGTDGDYVVPVGATRDLAAEGYARAFRVTSLGVSEAIVDVVTPGLAPGDEVLLVNVLGTTASLTGLYETKRVARVDFGRVTFTEPVRNLYGATANGDLGANRVYVQRIPQFNNVTVESTGSLTATGVTGGGSGVLFLRARGTVRVSGSLSMSLAGLAAGTPLNVAAPGNTMSRLFLGGGGSLQAGGGVVVVSARTVSLRAEGGSTAVGQVRADSTGTGAGAGGSVWLLGGTLAVGQGRVGAQGATAGQDGRVRLDYGALLDAPTTTPPPSEAGQKGAFFVISLPAYVEDPSSGVFLRAPRLYGVVGGGQVVTSGLPTALPGVNVDVASDAALSWKSVNAGGGPTETFLQNGRSFRFRLRLETTSDEAVNVHGLAFSVTAGN